jgi:hypothetical protein
MPIASVLLTDTLDQWRIKTNQMISVVNTLTGSGDILSVNSPSAGQILVCDGNVFRNVTPYGDMTIDQNGHTVVSGISGGTIPTRGRIRFSGSMASLY